MKVPAAVLFCSLALCATLAAGEPAGPGAPLTLTQAIEAVLAHYPTLDAAQAAIDAARGRTVQSQSSRLPQVSAEGAYSYLSLRPYVAFSLPTGTSDLYETIQNSYNVALHASQLLTDFGRTDALVSLARSGELSAHDALAQARKQLGYQTIQAFYGTLLLRESVAVADEEIRSLDEARRIAERKFSGGTATKLDVLTTEVRLANARNARTDRLAALEKEETSLRRLLGYAAGEAVSISGGFDAPADQPDLAATIEEGLRNRPEMRLARDAVDSAGLRLDAASRENRPTLAARAATGVEDGNLPAMYASRGYVEAGVSVSVPIFTGRRITGERIEARADLRGAQDRTSELSRTIAADVEDAFADLGAARARLASADTLVAQAQEALTLAKSRYANGVITNFELLDAQSSARAAELARLQARYDFVLARQAVARAAGREPQAQPN